MCANSCLGLLTDRFQEKEKREKQVEEIDIDDDVSTQYPIFVWTTLIVNIAIIVESNTLINVWYFTYSAIYGLLMFLLATFMLAMAIYSKTAPTRYAFI